MLCCLKRILNWIVLTFIRITFNVQYNILEQNFHVFGLVLKEKIKIFDTFLNVVVRNTVRFGHILFFENSKYLCFNIFALTNKC